ncbi:hypothetical protein [Capnocytophaga sputigena]|jgi:hypothetical protein|uniref:hypothetical protein n=1 Tax=Capnocytophaga sputigena TaxID=1019 RepID=UPI0028F0ED40|nr:hypothetical protein [Capnocytophaga sputigena]
MKNLYIILLSAFALTSCEEVIDLNLDTAPKKLVIDAALDWKKGEAKAYPIVDISYTEAYFGETHSPAIDNAVVKIVSGTQTYSLTLWDGTTTITFDNLNELKGGSRYVFPAGITPELGKDYELIVELDGQTYTAKDKMLEAPVVPPDRIVQKENGGFLADRKEVRFYFDGINDGVANAYLLKLSQSNISKTVYGTLDDNYIANNKFFFIMAGVDNDEKLNKGDVVNVILYRIHPQYKEFAQMIVQISRGQNPFAIPTRPIGNIVNTTNKRENPLGAFRVAQYTALQYTVK